MPDFANTLREHVAHAENLKLPRMASALRHAAEAAEARGFWYMASPYSKFCPGIGAAYREAVHNLTLLLRAKVAAFSPVVHSHPLAAIGGIDPYDYDVWLPADRPFMLAARGCIVLKLDGWDNSFGVQHELDYFRDAGKPVRFMEPGRLPVLPA